MAQQDIPEDAPEHCPGPQSEQAGKTDSCAGCPNQSICASGVAAGPDPAIARIAERLAGVRHRILVLSGKGGVGKSTVATNLAFALSAMDAPAQSASGSYTSASQSGQPAQVGILDLDICGPSLPKMTGVEGEQVHMSSSGWSPVYVADNLAVMSIGFMLPSANDAVIWRGAKKTGLIKQFLKDVDWGDLDYLIIDTPPGTSDEHLSVVQLLAPQPDALENTAPSGIDGAVIVTTPQELSLQDVRKMITFCRKVNLRILGVVENMSGFVCPKCTKSTKIFAPVTGGASRMAEQVSIPFLGSIPIDPRICSSGDQGQSFVEEWPDSPATIAYREIVAQIVRNLSTDQENAHKQHNSNSVD